MRNQRSNQVARFKVNADVPITIGIFTFSFIFIAICLFLYVPKDNKQDVAFASGVIVAASGVYGAFYAGSALRESLYSRKIDRTVDCAVRWLDTSLVDAKKLTKQIAVQAVEIDNEDKRGAKIIQLIGTTGTLEAEEKELAIATVLNFLEQLAVFVEKEVVDEELLRDFYHTIVVRHYFAFKPWIEERQRNKGLTSKRLYKSLTGLYERWEKLK